MRLRFDQNQIHHFADAYSYPREEVALIEMAQKVRLVGSLTKAQLQIIARWKSPRSAGRIANNSEEYIHEITSFALGALEERSRIEALTLLDGVSWPTASVILHLFHIEKYPILDYRALWSVCTEVPSHYSFELWFQYVTFCRSVSECANVDMRTLDRALWQYSKLYQPQGEA